MRRWRGAKDVAHPPPPRAAIAVSAAPKPHPLSRSFAWQDRVPAHPRRLTADQLAQFNERGFVKLEGVFSASEIAAVTAAIDPFEAAEEVRLREAGGRIAISDADAITFTVHIAQRSDVLKAFAAHPAVVDICYDLMGEDVRLYWDQSVYKKASKPQEFPWHQDNGYTYIEPQQYLTLWLPLVDVGEDNGCPWIAPGLHKLGTLDHWLTDLGYKCLEAVPDAVAVPARAGDIIAFSSLTPHRTGPNLIAGSVRKAYILQYARDGSVATYRDGRQAAQDHPRRQFPILTGGRRAG